MIYDISHFGIRVVLKNDGSSTFPLYPRDIEGTVLRVSTINRRDDIKISAGNYKAVFDVNDTTVNVHVRWDNDTKDKYNSHAIHIRNFGRCPGYDSIWDNALYRMDLRPYHELKPISNQKQLKYSFFDNTSIWHANYGAVPKQDDSDDMPEDDISMDDVRPKTSYKRAAFTACAYKASPAEDIPLKAYARTYAKISPKSHKIKGAINWATYGTYSYDVATTTDSTSG